MFNTPWTRLLFLIPYWFHPHCLCCSENLVKSWEWCVTYWNRLHRVKRLSKLLKSHGFCKCSHHEGIGFWKCFRRKDCNFGRDNICMIPSCHKNNFFCTRLLPVWFCVLSKACESFDMSCNVMWTLWIPIQQCKAGREKKNWLINLLYVRQAIWCDNTLSFHGLGSSSVSAICPNLSQKILLSATTKRWRLVRGTMQGRMETVLIIINNHPNVQCLHFLHLHRHLIRQFPAQFPRFRCEKHVFFHQEFKECMEVIEEQLRDSNGMSGAWLWDNSERLWVGYVVWWVCGDARCEYAIYVKALIKRQEGQADGRPEVSCCVRTCHVSMCKMILLKLQFCW